MCRNVNKETRHGKAHNWNRAATKKKMILAEEDTRVCPAFTDNLPEVDGLSGTDADMRERAKEPEHI